MYNHGNYNKSWLMAFMNLHTIACISISNMCELLCSYSGVEAEYFYVNIPINCIIPKCSYLQYQFKKIPGDRGGPVRKVFLPFLFPIFTIVFLTAKCSYSY
jgi:hypothetical protein